MTCETHSDHTWTDVVIDFLIFKIVSNPELKSTFEHSKTKTEQHKTLWNFKQTPKNPQNKTERSFRKFKNFWWESNSKLFQNANSENEVIQTKIREFSKKMGFCGIREILSEFSRCYYVQHSQQNQIRDPGSLLGEPRYLLWVNWSMFSISLAHTIRAKVCARDLRSTILCVVGSKNVPQNANDG